MYLQRTSMYTLTLSKHTRGADYPDTLFTVEKQGYSFFLLG